MRHIARASDIALEHLLGICERAFQGLAVAVLAIMLAMNALNILLRASFDLSFAWVWPWTMVLFVWFVFLSLYLLYRQRRDVSISVIHGRIGPRAQLVLGLFIHAVVAASSFFLVLAIPQLMVRQAGYIEIVGLPRYTLSVPFLASSVLVLIEALHNILRLLSGTSSFTPFGSIGQD